MTEQEKPMTQPAYERLAEALKLRGGAAPVVRCREFYALLEELFTPEEAELAAKMPLKYTSAAEIATETGGDPKEVERILENMANKALLYSQTRDEVMHYYPLPLVPGMFEMQFTTGEVSERTKRLAHLFQDYFTAMTGSADRAGPYDTAGIAIPFPFFRVITIEQEIPAGIEILPYDTLSKYIDNTEYIAVGTCYCRHFAELLGRPCDKPKEVCMGFGPAVKGNADRGFGRLLSKKEAREILKLSEEAGLVHTTSNTSKYIDLICNCCICHCGILQSMKNAPVPGMAARSSFIASLEEGDCSGCSDCVERCPMDALTMEGDVVALDLKRCIGCGLCVSVCPTGALMLEPRERAPVPPWDRNALNAAMMSTIEQTLGQKENP